MKTKTIVTLLTAAMLHSGVAVLIAQDKAQDPSGLRARPPGKNDARGERKHGMRAPLTPEEREKLKAAREKAKSDPDVVAARDELKAAEKDARDTARAAILKDDPSMQAIFDKIDKAMEEKHAGKEGDQAAPSGEQPPPDAAEEGKPHDGPPPREFGPGPRGPRLDMLTEEERAKLRAAHEKVKDQADVKEARDKAAEAAKKLHEAVRKAMIKTDPGVEAILKKIEGRRGNRGRMGPPEGMPPGPPPGEEPSAPAPKSAAPDTTGT